jgi:tRNA pseudouridine13 synthase
LQVPTLDQELGINVYAKDSAGIGGCIRRAPEDFVVEEVLVDGSVASIDKNVGAPALSASASKQRHLLCVLVKRNWDTFVAVKNIAKQLGIDQARIHIAGIKDAKAVTAQHITIAGVTFEDARRIHIKDIEVRPIGYFRDEMSQFYLLGNRFTITIKNIKTSESTVKRRITETVEALSLQGGIPNFFGHQRFGTTRAITHLVGKAIVNGDFQKAALLFLAKPSPHEHPDSRTARDKLQASQDFAQALQNFPKQLRFERVMLHYLTENPTDFTGAFKQLPVKLQALFVQAYQSYLFNRFLSERLRRGFHLNAAEVGDYVVGMEGSGLPMTKTSKLVTASTVAEMNDSIKAGKMRVALPIVGFGQKLSEGEMERIEANVLEEEGVERGSFRVQQMPRISGKGGLRSAVSPIRNFKLEAVSHDKESPTLCQVKMSFMLLRGSYATVFLREIMKPRNLIEAGF